MKSAEVIKRLEADGWVKVRVKGDHHQFKREGNPNVVTVPHPTKDIKTGTLRNIQRVSGVKML